MTTRSLALDVLRGVAILGTLATNIWLFTNPEGLVGLLTGSAIEATPPAWRAVEAVLQQLTIGKFLGLLTIMFGIGLAIQHRSAQRAGRRWPGSYPVRAGLLFLDGVLHYLLVVEFDVLMAYAVTGAVVAYLLITSERTQRAWTIAAAVVHVVLLGLLTAVLLVAPVTDDPAPLDPNPYADGSFLDLVAFRLDNILLLRAEPVFIQAMSVALFLLGARLFRAGVLGDDGAGLRRRLLVVGALAAPVDAVMGLTGGTPGILLSRYGTAPLVSLGLLALVVIVVRALERRPRGPGAAAARLAEVGRTALSSYVLQNLIAATICYGWGFGLAARLAPADRVPATIGLFLVVAVMITGFAHLWLRRFSRGPVEWLWHASYEALTRHDRQPDSASTSA